MDNKLMPFPFYDANLPVEQKWSLIKQHRNMLLDQTDWTQMPDADLTTEQKEIWIARRKALRNIPQDFNNPDDVVFPEMS
jgi:hypothetical protein